MSAHRPPNTAGADQWRIAAAAPDLLEALRGILPYLEEDPDDEGDYNARVRAIRAAIAKAEGKP